MRPRQIVFATPLENSGNCRQWNDVAFSPRVLPARRIVASSPHDERAYLAAQTGVLQQTFNANHSATLLCDAERDD
jgi:hypothetical protein